MPLMQYLAMDSFSATADRVATLHCQSLPIGFISSLGPHFVSLMYSAIAAAPNACVIVCRGSTGEVVGFAAGTTSTGEMFKWILPRYGMRFMWTLVTHFFSPSVIRKIGETVRYMGESSADSGSSNLPASVLVQAELLSIAVSSESRKLGVGLGLVGAFEAFLRGRLCHGYKVVTHKADPASNAFYMAAGFALQREFEHHGRPMCEYVKHLKA
jgi:hypothetical protein